MVFHFTTIWQINAPIEKVCNAIYQSDRWPEWWPSVKEAEDLISGDEQGIGRVCRFIWQGRLPYRLHFDMEVASFSPLHLIEGLATGDVIGIGRWVFSVNSGITEVRYEWRVRIANPWISFLAGLTAPIVRWNHNGVMQQGGESLARLLNATLINIEHY